MNNNCNNIKCHTIVDVKNDTLCFDNTPADRKCIISDHLPVCIEKDDIKIVSFNIGKKSSIEYEVNGKTLKQCSDTIINDFFNKYLLLYNIICLQETDNSFIHLLKSKYISKYYIFHNADNTLCILVDKQLHISNYQLLNVEIGVINIRILELFFIYNSKNYIIYNCKYFYNGGIHNYMKNHEITINLLLRIYHYFMNKYNDTYENVLCVLGDFNDNNIKNVTDTNQFINPFINPYLAHLIGLSSITSENYNFSNIDLMYNPKILLMIMYNKFLTNYMNYIYIILQIFSNDNIIFRRRTSKEKIYYNDYIFIINDNHHIKNNSYINIENIIRQIIFPKDNIYIDLFQEYSISYKRSTEEETTDEAFTDEDFTDEGTIDEEISFINMTGEEINIIKNIIILLCKLNDFLVEQSFNENPYYDSSKDINQTVYDKGEKLKKYIDILNKYIDIKKNILEFFRLFNIINEKCEIDNINISNLNLDSEKLSSILISYNNDEKLEITESDSGMLYIYIILDLLDIFPLADSKPLQIDLDKLTDSYDNQFYKNDKIKLNNMHKIINIMNKLATSYYHPSNTDSIILPDEIKKLNNINRNIDDKFKKILEKKNALKELIKIYIKKKHKLSVRHKYLKYKYKYLNLINNNI